MSNSLMVGMGHQSLANFVLIGEVGPNDSRSPWWNTYETQEEAGNAAISWAICGFDARVMDMKLQGSPNIALGKIPTLVVEYPNLLSVMDAIPGVTQYCKQLKPVAPPHPISQDDFKIWLINFSHGTPTFQDTTPTTTP